MSSTTTIKLTYKDINRKIKALNGNFDETIEKIYQTFHFSKDKEINMYYNDKENVFILVCSDEAMDISFEEFIEREMQPHYFIKDKPSNNIVDNLNCKGDNNNKFNDSNWRNNNDTSNNCGCKKITKKNRNLNENNNRKTPVKIPILNREKRNNTRNRSKIIVNKELNAKLTKLQFPKNPILPYSPGELIKISILFI